MTLHEFRCDRTSTHHSLEGMEGQSPLRPPYPWSRGKLNTRRVKEQRNLTPTQACPRPGSLGRNLRSKTRWFTGFCNSHQVSHFATFFIDARTKISVAESHPRSSTDSSVQTSRCGAHLVPPRRHPWFTLAQFVPRGC